MFCHEVHADLDTPVSTYLKLRQGETWSFLYESVEGRETWANYSIIGVGAHTTYVYDEDGLNIRTANDLSRVEGKDPLECLRAALAENSTNLSPHAPPLAGGVFGFLSYDIVRRFEPVGPSFAQHSVPLIAFVRPELVAVFDNRKHALTLYAEDEQRIAQAKSQLLGATPIPTGTAAWEEPTAVTSAEDYKNAVVRAKNHILAGDIFQVVLSRRFELPIVADPFDVYRGLRKINPSPYLYHFACPHVELSGASPEVMVRILDGEVAVRPIAGTRPRGATPQEDKTLANELLADQKERAEHIMLIDLGRNDVGRVSKPGTVRMTDTMVIENYSHVMHIVSEVRGHLSDQYDAFDAVRAAFPAGTLSGTPKVRAMQLINELERRDRGIYGGAVGYFAQRRDHSWDADFGIAIRTLESYDNKMVVQAGAGIVADSDPDTEVQETEHKAKAVFRAAQWAAQRTPC